MQQYVETAKSLGFTKATVINRSTFEPIAFSSPQDVAATYTDTDEGVQVDENQELRDDWKYARKTIFRFYRTKFSVVTRDLEHGNWIVGKLNQQVIVAHQFNSMWFVVYANAGFRTPVEAFNSITAKVFDTLIEAGI
jgi:hypothetical protein